MPAKKRVSQIVTVPAPIGGWNVRDPLPMMQPNYAPVLDNCFCLPSEIQVRRGYTKFATFTGTAETVMDYSPSTGSSKLLAAISNGALYGIFDITAGGAITTPVVSGLTSAQFKHCHYATTGGNFSYFVNNSDNAILHDGTNWYTVTTTSSPYAITGPTNTIFRDVITHKRRLWFLPDNSLAVWYLPTDQIAGAAVKFDFSPIFPRGGKIIKIDTWSLDAGVGLDDYFVVVTSEGEVAIYTGTDPAAASTWSLQGVFYIGTPTGTGHTCKFGGDLLMINKDGIAQMSKSLMSSRVNTWLQLTDKIQPRLAQDTTDYQNNSGWDILLFPPANMLLVNIPIENGQAYQYVMNTISGGWARWTGIPAKCWYYANDMLLFGADGYVAQAWNSQNDDGMQITADILPAYQNFGSASQLKRWTMGRVLIGTTAETTYGARVELDFNLSPNQFNLPFASGTPTGIYGVTKYDQSVYGGQVLIKKLWKNVSGIGYWGSMHIKFQTLYADVRLYSYDVAIESGGNI